jgi:SAM-dependent methyltransferase
MTPRRLYWKLREVVRHPRSEFLVPIAKWLARLRQIVPGVQNRVQLRRLGVSHIPPAPLRYRVHGHKSIYGFLNTGRRCRQDIASALERVGRAIGPFHSILDFGCGCGRTLIWLSDLPRSVNVYGTDIDVDAITWCQRNYAFGKFAVNGALPPLDYPDRQFDLVYVISVFTHINEEQQLRWLVEFKRVIVHRGILLITLHGEHAWRTLPSALTVQIKQSGILFVADAYWKGIFPEWYQTTYHTREYVQDTFSRYFKVLNYIPRGMAGFQDVVVLQNGD